MATTRRSIRHQISRQSAAKGASDLAPTMSMSESAAAKYVVDHQVAQTLNTLTTAAYVLAYPQAPQGPGEPDFYTSPMKWINAWVRIRELVETLLSQGPPMPAMPGPTPPLKSLGVPFAVGADSPVWPVIPSDSRGCVPNYLDVLGVGHGLPFQRFLAPRSLVRYHVGHDCIANYKDVVVAPEDAVVAKINNFLQTTDAVWLHTSTGLTIILGETLPGSPAEFGIKVGSRVAKGQHVARVGTFEMAQTLDMHMVHFETHQGHITGYQQWYDGHPAPVALRNPTAYLLRALPTCKLALGIQAPQMNDAKLETLGRLVMGTDMRH